MQATLGSRRRPALDSPRVPLPHQQPKARPEKTTQLPDDQLSAWPISLNSPGPNNTADSPYYSGNLSAGNVPSTVPQISADGDPLTPTITSNQLVRRNANQQLAAREQWPILSNNDDIWGDFGTALGVEHDEQEEELDQRAAATKRQALAERKQIPPFILKLSSFLDDPKYSDLIRWAPNGKSFIVLDEEEFGKRVIPERFKHNNYASFVRQLNMYGFHKNVGLSDNSMRSSENKTKAPSQYAHPYFQRGKPDYLWLIKKPKNAVPSSKRKKDGTKEQDSDEDGKRYGSVEREEEAKPLVTDDRLARGAENQNLVTLPRAEYTAIQQELESIQRSQRFISNAIQRLREQNNQLYQQASAFQTQHDRHENSINAILTFLATFYNRSLEGYGTTNHTNMFHSDAPHHSPPQGSVLSVDDGNDPVATASNQLIRSSRKLQLLLPPVASQAGQRQQERRNSGGTATPGSVQSAASSHQGSQRIPYRGQPPQHTSQFPSRASTAPPLNREPPARSPPLKQDVSTPDMFEVPESNDMMSVIHNLNASSNANGKSLPTANPSLDFSSALRGFENANGNSPLTTEQRRNILNYIAATTTNPSSSDNNTAMSVANRTNNALVSPQPPPGPDINQFAATNEELEMLQRLQEEQDAKMQSLADRLQPLSPSGSIPGFPNTTSPTANATGTNPASTDFDFDRFINDADYFAQHTTGDPAAGAGVDFGSDDGFADGNMPFDFGDPNAVDPDWGSARIGNVDGMGVDGMEGLQHASRPAEDEDPAGGGGRIESLNSSEATSPANTAYEGQGQGKVQGQRRDEERRPSTKKRKRG